MEHNCQDYLIYAYTNDIAKPFGEIDSIAVFKCSICGEEFTEEEINVNKVWD